MFLIFFSGSSPEDGPQQSASGAEAVSKRYDGMEVIITETGYPTGGPEFLPKSTPGCPSSVTTPAVPGVKAMETYMNKMEMISRDTGLKVFHFEPFDSQWKRRWEAGNTVALTDESWGLLKCDRTTKGIKLPPVNLESDVSKEGGKKKKKGAAGEESKVKKNGEGDDKASCVDVAWLAARGYAARDMVHGGGVRRTVLCPGGGLPCGTKFHAVEVGGKVVGYGEYCEGRACAARAMLVDTLWADYAEARRGVDVADVTLFMHDVRYPYAAQWALHVAMRTVRIVAVLGVVEKSAL